ncbi:MAG: peptidyl-prolyl cis-trans isomerase [Oscillospiraceae bacterium]|nr:peptidyl-prolyl cis-trans isomerase [Oscillospiraceae bacterium]
MVEQLFKRIIGSIVLAAAVLVCMAASSCGLGQKPAMALSRGKIKETISSEIYGYYLSYAKTRMLYGYYQTAYGASMPEDPTSLPDIPELWPQFYATPQTYGSIVKRQAESSLGQLLAIAVYCKENGLELSGKELSEIDGKIEGIIGTYFQNSKSRYNSKLKSLGINDKIYREIKKYEALAGVFGKDLFDSETGKKKITDDMVNMVYGESCARVKHILILYSPGTNGPDGSPDKYSDEEMAARYAKVEDIYGRIENGEDFDGFLSESEDPGSAAYPDGYTINESAAFMPEFVAAAFEMQIGETRKVETGYGMHIMKRFDLLPAADSLDLDNGATWRNVIFTEIQTYLMDEALKPYVEDIEIDAEQTKKFNVSKIPIMFDCLELW